MGVDADRWLEIDLYWFHPQDVTTSAEAFWERFAPLLEGVQGWQGVIINAGWLVDHVLDWRGDLSGRIPFPQGLTKDKFFSDDAPLLGSMQERHVQWRARFEERGQQDVEGYQPWTYGELARLVAALREVAGRRHGLPGVLVGSFVLGWLSIYDCAPSAWAQRHPEAFFKGPWRDELFDVTAQLTAEDTTYGAFPNGIAADTPISRFFGRQWGAMSEAVGLDAIVLRDSMIGQGIYERVGPYGLAAPEDPALVAAWSEATAALVRETKLAAPDKLVIGYSNAASAVADWRVNCADLEAIAREGYLDAWIDQTWAGAWGEVGQRDNTFYNEPLLGWTHQLGYLLLHAAALAGTRVKHYTLTETFDAWESWDIIHTAPERLRWGIWAYLHAFVKTPDGLRAPAGTYVSWMNQGKRLLTEGDVAFLALNINEATTDARATIMVHGPTAVYSRPAMEWQSAHDPASEIKEWIDEQVANLAKFSVPVTSVTRSEWLAQVDSDMFIIQTPVHLPNDQREEVLRRASSGEPLLVIGSPATGVDPAIAQAVGLTSDDTAIGDIATSGERGPGASADGVPDVFELVHPRTSNTAADDAAVVYSVGGSPALVRRGPVLAWDASDVHHRRPNDLNLNHNGPRTDRSMAQLMGSSYPFLLTAREISDRLRDAGRVARRATDSATPLAVGAWTLADGSTRVLVGNLEEGFRETTDGRWEAVVDLPERGAEVHVDLGYGQSQLYGVAAEEKHARPLWSER